MFRAAVELHRAGHLEEAERAYRGLLAAQPDHADALHLLGGIAFQRGQLEPAAALIRRAIQAKPGVAAYHLNLAAALSRLGRLPEAEASCRQALAIDPGSAEACDHLGNILAASGRSEEALASYRRAVALAPSFARTHYHIGNLQRAAGRLAEAIASYRQAIATGGRRPPFLHNLGVALVQDGALAEGEACFREVLQLRSDDELATRQLGLVLAATGRLEEAAEVLLGPVLRRRAPAAAADGTRAERSDQATAAKLRHDADQLLYLLGRGLVAETMRPLVAEYRAAAETMDGVGRGPLPATVSPQLRAVFNRPVHVAPAARQSEPVLGKEIPAAEIEERFARDGIAHAHFDGLLADPALAALQRFCLESTIWSQTTFRNEISSSLFTGFCCPLLLQITEELRQAFPTLLGAMPLSGGWAYKYLGESTGLGIHADDGAMSVNFWITPDEANLDPACGGLLVWDRQLPVDYLSKPAPVQEAIIAEILGADSPPPQTISYRCNRAVIFRSMTAHATDRFRFKQGYEDRRINVTLLFGHAS